MTQEWPDLDAASKSQELTDEMCPDDREFVRQVDRRFKEIWWLTSFEAKRLLRIARSAVNDKQ